MEKPSPEVLRIVGSCLDGGALSHADALRLCDVEAFTPDYYVLMYAMRTIAYEASHGIAEIHGQIGIDADICSKNCEFCSFAAINAGVRERDIYEMPLEKILAYARDYWENGANCLSVMITADYDFEKYLGVIEAIHRELPEFPIMANMGDLDAEMASELRAAGATSIYHAIRMREGVITAIPLQTRVNTIERAHEAGLKVATCVEMITPECSYEDIVSTLELSVGLEPEAGFTAGILAVPGTKMYGAPRYSWARGDVFSAVRRLMQGPDRVPFGSNNMTWAEVGTNPRDDKEETEHGGMGPDLVKERLKYRNQEWTVNEGPSPYWA